MSEQGRDLATIFEAIADGLDIQGENYHRILAYRRAADSLRALGEPLEQIWREGRLGTIAGIGDILAAKIDEYMRTGEVRAYTKLQDQIPLGLLTILQIPGMGPRRTRLVWQELGITSVEELESAASAGQLHHIKGIGPATEQKVLEGIRAWKRQRSERIPLGVAWPLVNEILGALRDVPGVQAAEPVGSLRRMRETLGDLDLLAAAESSEAAMICFRTLPMADEVLIAGTTKSAIRTTEGIQVDLRVVPPERWGSALYYFTGSQAHHLRMRALGRERGLSLGEYGFRRLVDQTGDEEVCVPGAPEVVCADEACVYATLGLPWIPPELREDRGEIAAALEGRLPHLVTRGDLLGDFQCRTTFSDGDSSLLEMAQAARAAGLRYIVVSDHTGRDGVQPEAIPHILAEVAQVNRLFAGEFRVIAGIEVNIQPDGSLDWPDEALARMEFVIASCHTDFGLSSARMTERLLAAMRNPYVDLIGHPRGRWLGKREAAALDMDAVLAGALEYGVALEINAWPQRLDLNDVDVRQAVTCGVPLAISTSAHDPDGLAVLEFGVAMARRGWVEPRHLLNTRPADEILDWRRQRLRRRGVEV
ncbi:MAG TPA: helix-hairpin-helix domain-containing protein [Anaerolineae bacterium]|nr:helix-hairpin-helix domain-containing protein [Anaerolineae bacterium]HQK12999.1 helix-hairpin-helix domain-containing protein [Anaerolineae bacterium]